MDVLSQNIKVVVEQRRWRPISVSRGGPSVSHIFFADVLPLFGAATPEQAAVMEGILTDFCLASGQKVSYAKSQFYASNNTRQEVVEVLPDRLKMHHTVDLGRYLGMPVIHNRVTTHTFDFLISDLREKLNS